MAERRRSHRSSGTRGRVTALVSLGAVFLVAVALAAAAIVAANPAQSTESSVPPPSYDLPGGGTPTPAPVPTQAVEPIASPTRTVAALNETGAWRAPVGACPGGPVAFEYTTDGGATWKPSTSVGTLGVSAVLGVHRGPKGSVVAVGQAPADCSPQLFTTIARADKWQPIAGVEQEWYIAPGDPSSVNSPGGVRKTPCATVVAVRPGTDANAGVLCTDQRFFRTQDGGASWDGGILIPGARSVAQASEGYLVAAVGRAVCAGVQIEIVYPQTAPRDGSAAACHITSADTAEVSISVAGEAVWLWTGDEIAITTDRGATWH